MTTDQAKELRTRISDVQTKAMNAATDIDKYGDWLDAVQSLDEYIKSITN